MTASGEPYSTSLTLVVEPDEVRLCSARGSVLARARREVGVPSFELRETDRSLHRAQTAIRGATTGRERSELTDRVKRLLSGLGRLLGHVLTRGVTDRMETELERARAAGRRPRVGLVITDPGLRDLTWEALILPSGTTPLALRPDLVLHRAHRAPSAAAPAAPAPVATHPPASGPHLVAALADPVTTGNRGSAGSLLDLENETRRLALAVSSAPYGIELSLLSTATTTALSEVLTHRPADIVHIACHAVPGALHLEDGRGGSANVTATELSTVFSSTAPPGVLFLAGCSTATGTPVAATSPDEGDRLDAEWLPGFAEQMARSGVPVVVSMSGPVSDDYAGRLASGTYGRMATSGDAPDALHRTRVELEERRRRSGGADPPEWYLTVVVTGGPDGSEPAVDPTAAADRAISDEALSNGTEGRDGPGTVSPAPLPLASISRTFPLALPLGQFVGRRAELHTAANALLSGARRGVLVHGIGGGGKSAFVGELLHRLPAHHTAVVLSGKVEPDRVLTEVSRSLGLDRSPPWRPGAGWRDSLATARGRGVVLVLDDFEQNLVVEEDGRAVLRSLELARFLSAWLSWPVETPGAGVVLASRRRFRLPENAQDLLLEIALPPLSTAESALLKARLPTVSRLRHDHWEQIERTIGGHPRTYTFLEALLRSSPDGPEDMRARVRRLLGADLAVLVRRVGGRVRLAVSEAVRLSVADTLLAELVSGLDQPCSRLLHRLSVHRRPAPLRALTESGDPPGTPGTDPVTARTRMDVLLDRGLVVRVPGGREEHWLVDRWTGQELRRLLPGSRTADHAEAAEHWWSRFTEEPPDPMADREVFASEAMFHYSAAGDSDAAFRTGSALCGRLHEAGWWTTEARVCRQMFPWAAPGSRNETMVHRQLGLIERDRGNLGEARKHLRTALTISRSSADALDTAFAEHQLGSIAHEEGELDEAAARYSRAQSAFKEADRPWEAAASLYQLSMVDEDLGRLEPARSGLLEAMAVFEEHGNEAQLGGCHLRLGTLAELEGDLPAAREHLVRAVEVQTRAGEWAGLMMARSSLGIVHMRLGEHASSYEQFDTVLTEAGRWGVESLLASGLHNMGVYAQEQGELALAEDYIRQALEKNERIGRLTHLGDNLLVLAQLARATGRRSGAWGLARRSLIAYKRTDSTRGLGSLYDFIADSLREKGRSDAALRYYRTALREHRRIGDRLRTAEIQAKVEEVEPR